MNNTLAETKLLSRGNGTPRPSLTPCSQVPESVVADDPIARFQELFERARPKEPDATAMALATADATGAPSVRMVLLKSADASGFVFFTNYGSRKAGELAKNPRASLCFYWPSIGTQVRIEGAVERVSVEESDAYFATRPRESQIGAWASAQSTPLESPAALRASFDRVSKRFEGQVVKRPDHWGGYRVRPARIEFWTAGGFRLHDRVVYRRQGESWTTDRLYP
jgi:pyridoxamine 5'-phosphate oxidase